jgi:hypothetical protein
MTGTQSTMEHLELTCEIAEGLGAFVLRHERNMGYGTSLRSLFAEALQLGADVVVTLDAVWLKGI